MVWRSSTGTLSLPTVTVVLEVEVIGMRYRGNDSQILARPCILLNSAFPFRAQSCKAPGVHKEITLHTTGQGLYEVTHELVSFVHSSSVESGLCNVFVRHTSASVIVQENADPSAKRDLEAWLNRMVRENDPHFTHTTEGPDDMPAHIKSA